MIDPIIKYLLFAACLFASLQTVVGCSKVGNVPTPDKTIRTVKDDLGRTVRVPQTVERAVSLAPNLTEMVFAVGAGNRLVGDTTYCNYPDEARSIRKVGDTLTPNLETIVALKPDVVLVSTASQLENFTNVLERNGIAVYVTDPQSIDDVFKSMVKLGELFGTKEKAQNAVIALEDRFDFARHDKPDRRGDSGGSEPALPRVFLQISKEPLFTIGKDSFLTDLIKSGGGESVTKDVSGGYPKLSKETAVALNPEVIILSDSDDNKEPSEAFKDSPAVRSGRVYRVNADLISRPGPRLVDAIEQISKDLHPEKFK